MPPRKAFFNSSPTELPANAPKDAARVEFARRLQSAMVEKGWNQSELARRAAAFMPDGKFGRDNVSLYVRGMVFPGPDHAEALAKALGRKVADLIPTRGMPSAEDRAPPLDVKDLNDGRCWLKINQAVDWPVALQVLELLKGQKGGNA